MITTTISFAPITNRARAGKWGKHIMCPNCKSINKVITLVGQDYNALNVKN